MKKSVQFHTMIPKDMFDSFKELCSKYNIAASIGIRCLVEHSLQQSRLPGMEPRSLSGQSQNRFNHMVRDLKNLDTDSDQKKAVRDVDVVVDEIIPMPYNSYLLTMARTTLKVLFLDIALDYPVLKKHLLLHGKPQKQIWPLSTNAYIALALDVLESQLPVLSNVIADKKGAKFRAAWHYFCYELSTCKDSSWLQNKMIDNVRNMTDFNAMGLMSSIIKPMLDWYLEKYLLKHSGILYTNNAPYFGVASKPKEVIKETEELVQKESK